MNRKAMLKKARPLLWVLSLVIAFVVGKQLKPIEQHREFQEQEAQWLAAPAPSANTQKGSQAFVVAADQQRVALDFYKGYSNGETGLRSLLEFYKAVQAYDIEKLKDALYSLPPDINDPAYFKTMSVLLEQYMHIAPDLAMKFVQENYKQRTNWVPLKIKVLRSWLKQDPHTAFNWYAQTLHTPPELFEDDTHIVFTELARQDVDMALSYLNELTNNRRISRAIKAIANNLSSNDDYLRLMQLAQSYDNFEIDNSVQTKWVKNDEQGFLDWYASIESAEYKKQVRRSVFSSYRKQNNKAAINWLLSNSNRMDIKEDLSLVVQSWGGEDPSAAIQWADRRLKKKSKQYAIYALLKSTAFSNPDFANSHLERLKSTKQKVRISQMIYSGYAYKSSTKAKAFLASSPYQAQLKQMIGK